MLTRRRCQFVLGLLVIAVSLIGCNTSQDDLSFVSRSSSTLTVNVMRIEKESQFTDSSVHFGILSPKRQSVLRFRRAGIIKSLYKVVGDSVAQGEKLAELDQTQLENQKQELQQAISRLQEEIPNPNVNLSQQQSNYRAQLQRVDADLANGIILAPFNCIVTKIDANVGDPSSIQKPVLEVAENDAALVQAEVPASIAGRLSVGGQVWVTIKSKALEGTLKSISPVVSSVGNKRLTLDISGDAENATATMFGQTVKIKFLTERSAEGFWVPQSALVGESNGLWSILVTKPNEDVLDDADAPTNADNNTSVESSGDRQFTVVQTLLEVVSLKGDWAFVQANLDDNELVIVDGTHRVVSGQRVKVNDSTSELIASRGDDSP